MNKILEDIKEKLQEWYNEYEKMWENRNNLIDKFYVYKVDNYFSDDLCIQTYLAKEGVWAVIERINEIIKKD